MKEKKLVIVGAGDLAREIFYAALEDKSFENGVAWKPVAFVVDSNFKTADTLEDVRVLSFEEAKEAIDAETHFIIGVGDPATRKAMREKLSTVAPNAKFGSVIHRSAVIMPRAVVEDGAFIAANTTIAIGCRVGAHTVINQNSAIGHDCVIGEYSVVSPGCVLSGRTTVGSGTFLGSVVVTYPKTQIGDNCMVSAGVVVARNIKSGTKQILKPNTMSLPS